MTKTLTLAGLLSALAICILTTASSAAAQDKANAAPVAAPAPKPVEIAIKQASADLQAGNAQAAMTLVEPYAAQLDQQIASEKRQSYCGMSMVETLLYMMMAAQQKKSAVALGPELCDALFIKGFALVDLDRVAEAQAIFKHLVDLAPMHGAFVSELANTYRVQKNWAAALETYESAEAAAEFADKPDVAARQCIALRGQGYVLVELGKWDDAEKAYRKCLGVIPDEPKSLGELRYVAQHRK